MSQLEIDQRTGGVTAESYRAFLADLDKIDQQLDYVDQLYRRFFLHYLISIKRLQRNDQKT